MGDSEFEKLMGELVADYHKSLVPAVVQIELTKRCNLDCIHCYVNHEREGRELDGRELRALIDELARMSVLILAFTGGEIFLRKDIWELIEYAKNKGFFIRLLTTGTTLAEKDIERLHALAVGEVHISLYSHRAEIHDKITRRPGSWQRSIDAVRMLIDAGISVLVKTAVLKLNAGDIPEMLSYIENMGAAHQLDTNIVQAEQAVREPLLQRLSESEFIDFYTHPAIAAKLAGDRGIASFCEAMRLEKPEGGLCNIGREQALIDAFGQVSPCALYPPIDSIRKHSFGEIWQESEILKRLRSLRYENQHKCAGCSLLPTCNPCPALAMMENGDPQGCNSGSRLHAIAFAAMDDMQAKKEAKE